MRTRQRVRPPRAIALPYYQFAVAAFELLFASGAFITVPTPKHSVKKATVALISRGSKVSTVQALKGYDYLKSQSSRKASAN
jgi:hypothetical protein